ncbi:MAG: hypothetical protein IKP07_03500 [Bacilli bacterium]|nr:hypothetical protein [Bacilli bacterium]
MPFTAQTEYGQIVAAKLRSQLVAEGLFARKYVGDAKAAAVMVPVTDEVTVADYNKGNLAANSVTYDGNAYITVTINKDRFVSLYLDGFNMTAASYDEKADALDKVAYGLAKDMNAYAIDTLVKGAQGLDKAGNAFGSTDPRYLLTGSTVSVGSNDVYDSLLSLGAALTNAGVPMDGRYIVVNGTGLAAIMGSNKTIRQGDMAQDLVKKGFIAQIAGFNVKVSNLVTGNIGSGSSAKALWGVVGHPEFATDPAAFKSEPRFVDGDGDANVVGGAFVKGRVAYTYEVINPKAFGLLTA